MKFEHLIRMTPPPEVSAPSIAREVLWQGLLCRARLPMTFDENITFCDIRDKHADGFTREIHFGALVVIERVELDHGTAVHYETQASAEHPAARRSMIIEEPETGVLFVRFRYETEVQADAETSAEELERLLPYLQSAYRETDLELAKRILQLAYEGGLPPQ